MKLVDLLDGVKIEKYNVYLAQNIEFIANDHRRVKSNTLFVAIQGTKRDGNEYISKAIKNGAVAVITDRVTDYIESIPFILVENTREALAKIWSNFYKNPSKNIKTIAITGTNGKTSTAYFLYNILLSAGIPCGLISTIGCFVNGLPIETNGGGSMADVVSAMTTPDPEILYYIYKLMKDLEAKIVVIEASSHALDQKRLSAIEVEIGVFTNMSREHLDYHGSIDEYFFAKESLFQNCKFGIVNVDDKYGRIIKNKYRNVYGFSCKSKNDFYTKNAKFDQNGCSFDFVTADSSIDVATKIIGEFTMYNAGMACSCANLLGINDLAIKNGIMNTILIKGRLERYMDKKIYIDYAHTPEAVKRVIETVKNIEPNKRLIVLFGCGGDRDKGKRGEMGRICTTYADFTVITSDNCRSEDPNNIIEDILLGVANKDKYTVIIDRKEAIRTVVKGMTENDILLLLGKGHEEYDITKDGKKSFSEKEVLNEVFMIDK